MSENAQTKQQNSSAKAFFNGLITENPTFVLNLGMCPTLAVTTSAMNGLGMGLTTTAVLVLSNMIISLLRNIIPDKVRIPAFIVIIASFVTVMELLLQGFIPSLYDSLGIYIPLIVVNCIILGRAEAFASKNPAIPSGFDGLGMGLGFTVALTCIGAVRELLGAGEIFGLPVMSGICGGINHVLAAVGIEHQVEYVPISIFIMAPGAFFVLATLIAIQNRIRRNMAAKGKSVEHAAGGCCSDCAACGEGGCAQPFYDASAKDEVSGEEKKNG